MKTETDLAEATPVTWRQRLLAHLVQPVPDTIALCEFSCSATVCSPEMWRQCQRRLAAPLPPQNPGSQAVAAIQ